MNKLLLIASIICLSFSTITAQVFMRVGPGQTYSTIQAAYNAIPATATSSYYITLEAGYNFAGEVLPVSLTNRNFSVSNDSIIIYPNAAGIILSANNAARMFTISGDRIVMDGRVGASGTSADLSIIYAITSSTPTPIAAIDGKMHIRYCNFTSSNNYSTILNNPYTVVNCDFTNIAALSSRPKNAIVAGNQTVKIINNTFSNFSAHSIIAAPTAFTSLDTAYVYNNSFFNTEPTTSFFGVSLTSTSSSSITNLRTWHLKNNYFGGDAPLCQGGKMELTNNFTGIERGTYFHGITVIDSNFFQNVAVTGTGAASRTFIGVGGNMTRILKNIFGSTTDPNSLVFAQGLSSSSYSLAVYLVSAGLLVKGNSANGIKLSCTPSNLGTTTFMGFRGTNVVGNSAGGLISGQPGIQVNDSANGGGAKIITGFYGSTSCDSNLVQHISVVGKATFIGVGNGTISSQGSAASVSYNMINNIYVNSVDSLTFIGIFNQGASFNRITNIQIVNPLGGAAMAFREAANNNIYKGNVINNIEVKGKYLNSDKTFTFAVLNSASFNSNATGSFSDNLIENITITGNHRGFVGVNYPTTTTSISSPAFVAENNIFRNINASGSDSVYFRGFHIGSALKLNNNLFEDINLQANKLVGCNVINELIGGSSVHGNVLRNINLTSATADTAWFHGLKYNRTSTFADSFQIKNNKIIDVALLVPNCIKSSFTGFELNRTNNTTRGTFAANLMAGNTYTPLNGTGYYYGVRCAGNYLIANNIIQLGADADGIASTIATRMFGILNTVNINTPIHYNTVVLTSISTGTLKTVALQSSTSIISYGNALYNVNTTVGGTNLHMALSLPNAFSGTFSNNLFWVDVPNGGVLASLDNQVTFVTSLPALQTAMPGQHAASLFTDALLKGPLLDTTAINYRPGNGSPLLGAGFTVPGITTDYFGYTRGTVPTLGAIEYGGNAMPIITNNTINCSSDTTGTISLVQPNADVWDSVRVLSAGGQVLQVLYNYSGSRQFNNLAAGTYTVQLYSGINTVRTTSVIINYILAIPNKPKFSFTRVCQGSMIDLTNANHVSGYTNYWYSQPNTTLAPDTTTTTNRTRIVMSATAVHYYLKSRITNGSIECFSVVADTIIDPLLANPAPVLVGGGDTIKGCPGVSMSIQLSATGTVSWFTVPSGGTAFRTGSTYSIVPTSNVVYYVQAQSSCLSPRVPIYVSLYPQVVVPPLGPSGGTVKVCSGETTTLSYSPVSGLETRWLTAAVGGFLLYTGNTYTTTPITADTEVYVEYYNPITGCKSPSRQRITIDEIRVGFTAPVDSVFVCPGETHTYTLTASSSLTYNWFTLPTGGTAIFTGNAFTTPSITTTQTYYVEATGTAAPFCKSERAKTTVVPLPLPATPLPIAPLLTVCEHGDAILQVQQVSGINFQWFEKGQTTLLGTGSVYIYNDVTVEKEFEVFAYIGGCRSTPAAVVSVAISPALPSISIVQSTSNPQVLTCTPSVFTSYEWTYNFNLFAGQSASILAQYPGNYSVVAYDEFGCAARSGNFFYTPVGMEDGYSSMEISLYPNPATEDLNITFSEAMVGDDNELFVYDLKGTLVARFKMDAGATEANLSVEAMPEGVYFAKITAIKGSYIGRFVKVNK
ncbi:hypothetical protein BH09BAC1_BH09BAC1_15150 [soil metagenome]